MANFLKVSQSLGQVNGSNAAALAVAEKYVGAFSNLAKTNNTMILPSNTGDVTSMVAQAMTIYTQLQKNNVAGDVIKTEAIGEVSSPKTDVEGSTISQTKD